MVPPGRRAAVSNGAGRGGRPAILHLVDDSLTALARKGTFGYIGELYNPLEMFDAVHHVSFYREDRRVTVDRPWFHLHVLWTTRQWLPGLGRLLDLPLCLVQLWWLARRHRVALVRSRGPLFGSALGIVVARLRGIPSVVSIGGDYRMVWRVMQRYPVLGSRRLTEALEQWVLRHADEVWCTSAYARQHALGLGVRPERVHVVPWRLRADIFAGEAGGPAVVREAGVDPSRPVVLFVGRLEPDKRPEIVLEALPEILRQRSDAQAVFVGDGSQRERLERRSRELGIAERVRWPGFQSTEAVKAWLAAATVVSIPMSGFVTFEAAAFGKAMAVCDVEWHPEFIQDGETGLLVPDGDSPAMARAVLRLIADPALSRRLGDAGRRRLREVYAPDTIARREVARLTALLEGAR